MNTTTLTIGGVILSVLGTLLARLSGLVTDAQLIHAAVVVAVLAAFTLLAWVWGAALTELQKRLPEHWPAPFKWVRIARPWTPRVAQEMFRERTGHESPRDADELRVRQALFKQADKARDLIYVASCGNGGIPLVLLLKDHFHPETFLGWALTVMYGLAVGGLSLPWVYKIAVHDLWPRLRAKGKKGIEVRRDQVTGEVVAIKDLDSDNPTEILRPGQKPPTAG